MTYIDGKHWDFFVHDTAFVDILASILAEHYDDGPLPTDYPGLRHDENANAWRYEPGIADDLGPLAYLRLRVLGEHLTRIVADFDVFTHDPATTEDVEVDRVVLRTHLADRANGSSDLNPSICSWVDPHLAPLMQGRNPDDFSAPVPLDAVLDRIVDAVADALESGAVQVVTSEPWDSCRGCGGYHNVNYDCA